ncbi:hypothetical protein JL722_11086 [Aureococcus anophagefferens]|nr:hypothetical protein JL722_11086 [Aureococcus anophagefferens]
MSTDFRCSRPGQHFEISRRPGRPPDTRRCAFGAEQDQGRSRALVSRHGDAKGGVEARGPTKNFLCPLSANEYGIEFLSFVIQDYDSKLTIFEVSRDRPLPIDFSMHDAMDPDSLRKINYELSEDFLRLPNISTTLVFSVGQEPLSDFRMIERHYFRDQLIKSYGGAAASETARRRPRRAEAAPGARARAPSGRSRPRPRADFSFGFCIPGSTNTWEAVYALPPMDNALVSDMIAHPYETSSDSFYFVGDKLIMHNKAFYKYIPEDSNAQCKSYESKYVRQGRRPPRPSPGAAGAKAEAKGAKSSGGAGAKAQAKGGGDDELWSKESDYF